MPKVILSNDSSLVNVPKSGNGTKGGILFNYKFVSAIYKGGATPTLIYEDSSAPTLSSVDMTVRWDDEVWAGTESADSHKYAAVSTESNPLPVSGYTSDHINMWYIRRREGHYSNGIDIPFWNFDSWDNTKSTYGNLYVDGTLQPKGSTLGTNTMDYSYYTIPECTTATGHRYAVYKQTLENLTTDRKRRIYEYQTSDEYSLFGLEDDSIFSSETPTVERIGTTDSHSYRITSSGVLIFRMLQSCQINLDGDQDDYYYCIADGNSRTAMVEHLTLNNISSLPSTMDALTANENYTAAGFKKSKGGTKGVKIDAGQVMILGCFGGNNIDFSFGDVFSIEPQIFSFTGVSQSGSIAVTAGSSISWTATTSNSWISITSGASGTGDGTVRFTATQNTSGGSRTGQIKVTASNGMSMVASVDQQSYDQLVTFTDQDLADTYLSENDLENSYHFSYEVADTTSDHEIAIPFVLTQECNLELTTSINGDVGQEDPTNFGVAIANSSSYSPNIDSVAFSNSQENSMLLTLSANRTYYLVVKIPSGMSMAVFDFQFQSKLG